MLGKPPLHPCWDNVERGPSLTERKCSPGRYFASRIMKITLAYSVLNYDLEYEPAQSDYSKWQTSFGNYNVPLEKKVVFRRRGPL